MSNNQPLLPDPQALNPAPAEVLLDGDLHYFPTFLSPDNADKLFQQLFCSLPWRQESLTIYGRRQVSPRLQCWLGERDLSYRYSGKTFVSEAWDPQLQQLAASISQQLQQPFNSVLANLYRDGQDSMGWHSDDEAELGPAAVIASLSLGAERDFTLRRRGESRQAGRLALAHGSLLVMNAGMQSRWQHALPKRANVQQPRINLTFRQILY